MLRESREILTTDIAPQSRRAAVRSFAPGERG